MPVPENRPWVHVELRMAEKHLKRRMRRIYLQPAGGDAAASGYDDEEKDKFSKGRPLVVKSADT